MTHRVPFLLSAVTAAAVGAAISLAPAASAADFNRYEMEGCTGECVSASVQVIECRVPGDPSRPGKISVRAFFDSGDQRYVRVEDDYGHKQYFQGSVDTVIDAVQTEFNVVHVWEYLNPKAQARVVNVNC